MRKPDILLQALVMSWIGTKNMFEAIFIYFWHFFTGENNWIWTKEAIGGSISQGKQDVLNEQGGNSSQIFPPPRKSEFAQAAFPASQQAENGSQVNKSSQAFNIASCFTIN